MNAPQATAERRGALIGRLLPEGVPKLWCPPLTHYDPQGGVDRDRIAAHLRNIAPYVKGLLVPGSTWRVHPGSLSPVRHRKLGSISPNAAVAIGTSSKLT